MRAISISLATALLAPTVAWCQSPGAASAVHIYGRVDASFNSISYSATAARPGSSGSYVSSDTSRWGIRGSEDLGGGLQALFKLESGFSVDTGGPGSATQFWNRESYVGLRSTSYGTVQLGSQFTPTVWLTLKTDPFQRSNMGAVLTLFQQGGPGGARGYPAQYNNAVQYIGPSLGGLVGRAMIATNEGVVPFGNPKSFGLEYTADRLFLAASYDRLNTAGSGVGQPLLAGVLDKTITVGAVYDFRVVKLHGMLIKSDIERATGMRGSMIGVSVPVGSGEVNASYQKRNVDAAANANARLIAVQYMYFLSKRSSVYVGYADQRNDGAAAFGLWPSRVDAAATGVPAAGSSVRGFQLGVRHYF